ncbi:hypothetical protein TrST_g12451 [Triparma strigata]|uniref:Endonuclease/exonuclease/phosphatase domain-containing protein n=2 Tax=Triparma strigata TaxID=1606541 RepID=A0A9W7EIA3_9STRA|nr:hypothetical protein TrST_g12451 [Triparma strigata]
MLAIQFFVLISLAAAVPSLGTDDYERLGVLTYNILDRGWSDEELLNWSEDDMKRVMKAFNYSDSYLCNNCDSYHVGFMSRSKIKVLEDISTAGHGAIAARIDGIVYVTFHLTPFADQTGSEIRTAQVDSVVESIISKYSDEPLLLMGDTNNPSPLDAARYNETLMCEGDLNYCMDGAINYKPIQHLLDAGLNDLCWYSYSPASSKNSPMSYNMCSDSCSTSIWSPVNGSPSSAKIDYIFGNDKFLEKFGVVHSRVQMNQQTDQASDHYPVELTFTPIL